MVRKEVAAMATKLPAPDSARRGLQTQVEAKKRVRVFRALFKALELLSTIVSILDGLKNLLRG